MGWKNHKPPANIRKRTVTHKSSSNPLNPTHGGSTANEGGDVDLTPPDALVHRSRLAGLMQQGPLNPSKLHLKPRNPKPYAQDSVGRSRSFSGLSIGDRCLRLNRALMPRERRGEQGIVLLRSCENSTVCSAISEERQSERETQHESGLFFFPEGLHFQGPTKLWG